MPALLHLHLHSRLNTWLQWIWQRQLQDETRDIKVVGFGALILEIWWHYLLLHAIRLTEVGLNSFWAWVGSYTKRKKYGLASLSIGLLPDMLNCGLRMRHECRELFPHHRLKRKPLVSGPGMHHDTCVTHVPCCMRRSLTHGSRENVSGIPDACAIHKFAYLAKGPWPDPN